MSSLVKLNETSPRVQQTSHGLLKPLWPHQLAMLHRCRHIEAADAKMGVISSIPGSGKTAVMLALLTSEKKLRGRCGVNLAVVPQGIYTQWQQAIEEFAGDNLKYKLFVEYADILELYYTAEGLQNLDLLLTTPPFYESIVKSCEEAHVKFNRVFLDEVDGINWFLADYEDHRKDIMANIVWNVSASFTPTLLSNLTPAQVAAVTCDCETSFVQKSLQLPEPIKTVLPCQDVCLEQVLRYVCKRDELLAANAGDYSWLHAINGPTHVRDSQEAVKIMLKNAVDLIESKKILYEERKKKRPINKEVVQEMEAAAAVIKTQQALMDTLKQRLEVAGKFKPDKSLGNKMTTLLELLGKTSRTIVFSTYPQVLGDVANQLIDMQDMSYGQLDGGNIKAIDRTVNEYKQGKVRILLCDTMSFGRGLNLEQTTDIVFMHKMDVNMEKQVIGRALRPGRGSTILNVWYLFNGFELSSKTTNPTK